MSKPALLQISYCVLLHEQNDSSVLTLAYDRIRQKYEAQNLSAETILPVLAHCNSHYGLCVTSNAHALLSLLKPFSKELHQAKIWIINLGEAPAENLPGYIEELKTLDTSNSKLTGIIKSLKAEIKLAIGEMRKHLAAEITAQKPTTEQQDVVFINRLNHVFEAHYQDNDLRTSFIAKALGISVSTLERKCEKLTGKLPNQLLTQFRLEKARQLITSTRLRMSDIAQQTGFTSSSYFSVRYGEYFGQTPSQSRYLHHKKAS